MFLVILFAECRLCRRLAELPCAIDDVEALLAQERRGAKHIVHVVTALAPHVRRTGARGRPSTAR